ncbi:BTAD domain-containing putative transcriptional regulator [Mesorhizobium sp. MSK_1335]|uniref:BTAD domain-containing putative transcriptional regulator n=1 Tax=Mesorhizobium montanum TaxID=3072323 RepID=A0ABU4ZP21_9HYPH|nr:BTAD domain-containing putative transcriptional regulator [Mesorhizobium sp. MSK_1335]MDX8525778.1 BTAD domain-containing putative transcriptional regulator [Mesorhizobium sp. MSK_1335]
MRIRLLGDLEVTSAEGQPVRFATRKSALLFAALALAGRRGHHRERLSEGFWPGRGDAQSRNSLRQALADIRRSFPTDGDAAISIEGVQETVALTAGPDEADIWVFERKLAESGTADLAFAAELYRGDVLAGEVIPDGLDEWFSPHQIRYRQKALQLVERLSLALPEAGTAENAACERLAERLLASDPTAEAAHRALMRIHAAGGHENAALRQFESCRALLRKHLDVEPEAQTNALAATLQTRGGNRLTATTHDIAQPPQPVSVPARPYDQPSVAVMAFDNLGGVDDEYFADGVVEEITAALSRIRDFFVIARQSAFTYKGRFVDVRDVGRELGVSYVVEGTVRRGGDRLRISVQLVDAETRTQLWSERYEGATEDVFEFQDRIAAQVAGAIHPAIRGAEIELAKRKPPTSLRAYDLVMRAYPSIWGRRKDTNNQAIELLKKAIAIDPAYSRAHALLAWCHASNAAYLWAEQPESELEKARAAVEAAGSIGDDPTALAAAGSALSMCGEQERAATFIEKALTLDPNNAWAWARHGWIAIYKDEAARAAERFQRAMTLSPMDPFAFNMRLGMATAMAKTGSFAQAVAIAREVIAAHPDIIMSYRYLAAWSAMSGDLETARWAAQKLLTAQPDFTIERYRSLPIFRNTAKWADQIVEALKQVGLPER